MDRIFDHKPTLGVLAIFEAAKSASTYDRLMKSLFNIYCNNSKSTFILEFLQSIAIAMTYMEKHSSVENVLDFAAKYAIYHGSQVKDDEDVLLLAVFEFIFDNHNRKLPAIRFRACEFVNRILNKMGPQASLDDDVFDKMASTMLEHLQDKMPSIRAQAVLALQRLQDPPNDKCRIIKAFMYHMASDPSCEVRARVVQNIAVTKRTLPLILGRLQDVKETVRKEAYRALTRLKPRKFAIHQRQTILISGLSDRSDTVKNFIKDHVIPSWFQECSCNILDFLSMLDVVSFKSEILSTILSYLFTKYTPKDELISIIVKLQVDSAGKKVIPPNELNPEAAVLWVSSVKHLQFDQCEGVILPELTQFAKYILSYCRESDMKNPDQQYVLKQLIEIAHLYSFMDEMGRRQLVETCVDILKDDNTGIEVVPPLAHILEALVPNTSERMAIMAELISDIREPLDVSHENNGDIDWEAGSSPKKETNSHDSVEGLAEGLSQLNCESQSLDDCTRAERTDPETLIKCLTIIKEMLKAPSVNKVDATLLSLKEHFIVNCFKASTDGRVVSLAIDTLSLLCILSLELAKEFFLQFCIQITNDSTCVSALEAVFDTLLVHGFEPFSFGCLLENDANSGINEIGEFIGEGCALDFTKDLTLTSASRRIVPLLTSLIKSNVREVKCKVCEGLTKLLLSSRIDSPIVLAHLIILWFSSATDTEPLIRQPLGLFFSVFSSRRVGAPEIILLAFSPTLRGIEELNDEEIDIGKVANLFVTLLRSDISTKVGKASGEKGSYHGRLALTILEEFRMEVIQNQILAKALSSLELDSRDEEISERLLLQTLRTYKWLSRRVSEKRVLNVLKKFKEEVEKIRDSFIKKDETKDVKPVPEEDKENLNINESKTELLPINEEENKSEITEGPQNNSKKSGDSSIRRRKNNSDSEQEKCTKKTRSAKTKDTQVEIVENDISEISDTIEADPSISIIKPEKVNGEISTVVEESTVSESDLEKSDVLNSSNSEKPVDESSEDIVLPSPPKRRMLRSRTKKTM